VPGGSQKSGTPLSEISAQEAEGKKRQIETFKIQVNIIYTAEGGHQSDKQLKQSGLSPSLARSLAIRELQEHEDVFNETGFFGPSIFVILIVSRGDW
jgi:hypothetical protein